MSLLDATVTAAAKSLTPHATSSCALTGPLAKQPVPQRVLLDATDWAALKTIFRQG
jgi:hypothetical protein